jgi:hypothetical protein
MGRYESGNYQFELECVVENELLRTQSSGQDREDAGSKIFGRTFRYSDFREEAVFTVPAAHRVEGVSTEGRVLTAFTLKAIRALPTSEFSEIGRIPDPSSADAIRGDVKFTTIVDFRPGAETITAKTPAGDRVSAIPRAQLGRPSSSSLRHVGWWSIAGVIGALVGIRVWRSTRAL